VQHAQVLLISSPVPRSSPPRPEHSRSHGITPMSQSQRPPIRISSGARMATNQTRQGRRTWYAHEDWELARSHACALRP
jgi:hypothetical protein